MKLKRNKTALVILCGALCLIACDKLFVHVEGLNADLQGKWQQVGADSVYYNFQNNLFLYQNYICKDSILSVQGYYNLIGDTAIAIELLPKYTFLNTHETSFPLDFIQWDTIRGTEDVDTLFQRFSIIKLNKNSLTLSNASKNYVFRKF